MAVERKHSMSNHLAALQGSEPKPYFTIKEVADLLKISYPTVQRRIKSLHIDLYTKGTNGRTKYIAFVDIDRIKELGDEFHPWTA